MWGELQSSKCATLMFVEKKKRKKDGDKNGKNMKKTVTNESTPPLSSSCSYIVLSRLFGEAACLMFHTHTPFSYSPFCAAGGCITPPP